MKILLSILAGLGLMSCSQDKIIYDDGDDVNMVNIVVDFADDTKLVDIVKIETSARISLRPNSPSFGKTKVMVGTILESNAGEIEDILEDSDIVDAFGTNFQYHTYYNTGSVSYQPNTTSSTPNDPMYVDGVQWNFNQVGADVAWGEGATGKNVIVAVVDTGVSDGLGEFSVVPDLASTCFVDGFNFIDDNTDAYDAYGHGTHVAGTIAQSTNNGYGVAGLAYEACIMPIKVLSDSGSGSLSDIVDGIVWATDNGANVINLSLGGGPASEVFEKAIKYAKDNNVFLSCSAGNSGLPIIEYPAGYDGCHAVSATGRSGNMAFYSSHGKSRNGNSLFITAPGGDMREGGPEGGIFQDTVENGDPTKHGFFPLQGTSMSAPHLSGGAAMVISMLGSYTVAQVEQILQSSAKEMNDEDRFGAGLLDVGSAVKMAKSSTASGHAMFTYALVTLLVAGAALLLRAVRN